VSEAALPAAPEADEPLLPALDLEPAAVAMEPGSYRDRNGAVFYWQDRVFRRLSAPALEHWRQLREQPFFASEQAAGRIVGTWEVDAAAEGFARDLPGEGAGVPVLEHERVPFISYPYEWAFGMLKDAALLHLELMRQALAVDMILKDSSAYNIQWRGAQPVFIDIPSFEPLRRGEPWVGYRQFCELFLYPLILQAYKGVDFRPWLRGRLDGIPAEQLRGLMSARDLLRPGVLLHVAAQAALQKRYSGSASNMRGTLAQAGFDKAMILRNVEKLGRLVSGLQTSGGRTTWSNYAHSHSYEEADFARKQEFVRRAAATRRWKRVWDLGCNTGTFSRIAAAQADHVIAMDGDWKAVEQLYQEEKAAGPAGSILPLVIDLADPSPAQGWLGLERRELAARGRPELTLCLALIHHIVISANIPLADFIRWLAGLGTSLVIEFVGREDEMVQTLLANREDQYDDYHPENFRRLLAAHFDIREEQELKGGKRRIFFATAKSPVS